jgi:Trk-type K+ transport system membrane component
MSDQANTLSTFGESKYFDFSLLQDKIVGVFLQILAFLPYMLIALIIWFLGSYLIEIGGKLFRKFFVKNIHTASQSHLNFMTRVIVVAGKIFLILFILDYLGIGKTFVYALTNSLSNAIAIMIGLSFGLALQDDAKKIIENVKNYLDR